MKIREELIMRQLGREFIIIDSQVDMVNMTSVITLNQSAAMLFEALKGKDFFVEDVYFLLTSEYNIHCSQASSDAELFIKMLREANMVVCNEKD